MASPRKDPSVFIGSEIHDSQWKQTKSTRNDPIAHRGYINDYTYPQQSSRHKKKPRPSYFLGKTKTKDIVKGFGTENTFRNETASTMNFASDHT